METKMAEDVSSTIAALEDERYTAMLSGDAAKLDRLLDDRLRHALPLFMVLSLLTVVASNAISGALSVFPNRAGAAAALAGALQFGAGAIASAAVGWSADGTPRPMSVLICAGAVAALVANLVLIRSTD